MRACLKLERPVAAAFAYSRVAIGERRLSKITPQLIADHRDLLLGAPCGGWRNKRLRKRSSATVRNYLVELSRLFTLAIKEMHVIDTNPVANIKKPKPSEWRKRFLSDEERARLLAACRESYNADLYPFVLFALTTGCRRGEAYGCS